MSKSEKSLGPHGKYIETFDYVAPTSMLPTPRATCGKKVIQEDQAMTTGDVK